MQRSAKKLVLAAAVLAAAWAFFRAASALLPAAEAVSREADAPFGRFFGLDGAIVTAFLLGLPANEIVLPIVGMIYAAAADLAPLGAADLRVLLLANGWTARTAACCILFSLFHFPCATTLWTIQKETGSTKWTVVAFVLPTLLGLFLCRLMVLLF